MLIGEYDYDTDIKVQKQESYEEGYSNGISKGISQGISQGAAQQKAEDEKILALKDAENARQAQRIAELEAMLAKR